MEKKNYDITGMSCSACSSRVEKAVSKLDGMEKVSVNLLTNSMTVDFNENSISSQTIIEAVEKAGYGIEEVVSGNNSNKDKGKNSEIEKKDIHKDEIHNMKTRVIGSFLFLIPLMILSMGHMVVDVGHEHGISVAFGQFLLLIPIVYLNRVYFTRGFKNLFRRSPNMDSLVAVGAAASILYGVFAIFRIGYGLGTMNMVVVDEYMMNLYFESAAMILTLITLGKFFEAKSKGKTSAAIEKLIDLSPKTATVERDGIEIIVPVEEVVVGEVIVIKPGESVPVDGIVIDGETSIDEANITGESVPVDKSMGDKVVSATVNIGGQIRIKAEKVGEDTTISQIIKLTKEASSSKAPIAKLADKIAGVFVPIVMIIAVISGIVWAINGAGFEFSLSIGIAVLVISCPCALGLATPVAIMVGTGKGAENGILIKSGEALEIAHNVDTVVLDKTGTITEGKPVISDIYPINISKDELIKLAVTIEKGSEHPLGKAIVKYGDENNIETEKVHDFKAIFGKGVKVKLHDKVYLGGNKKFIEEEGIDVAKIETILGNFADQGKTPIIFSDENILLGIVTLIDKPKESSVEAINKFKKMNIDVVMLTGDNVRTSEAIKKTVGITRAIGGVMPEDKEKHISELQKSGHVVAMIGDGVNDGPALARADVGIAIGAGSDIAIDSSDAVLVRNDLLDAVTAIRLSKAVIRNIKENLFWAFFYNSIGIPLAAGLLYPAFGLKLSPMFGAAAMSFSSVFVVGNALRLRKFKTDRKEVKKMNYELKVEGMMCMHCQKHVEDALNAMEGVTATVNLDKKIANVTATRTIEMNEFKKVIEDAGYTLK